jgi:quinohemoprotein amine dehydrogenase
MDHRQLATFALLTGGLVALAPKAGALAAETTGPQIIENICSACHIKTGDPAHPWSRISNMRKTPEGWSITLRRMREIRGAPLEPEDEKVLLKYLADHQGLAPEETADYRANLEQQPNLTDKPDPLLSDMCARCHSSARFSLQRRPAAEWDKLVNFHLGQFPTLELQAKARDRPWFKIATEQVVPTLAARFPLETQAWSDWQQAAKPALAGAWRVVGWLPEHGDYAAVLTADMAAPDRYALTMSGRFADGTPLQSSGEAIVYTGYEWRATLTVNGQPMHQVLAAGKDGAEMTGRLFEPSHGDLGGPVKAARIGKAPQILAVWPSALKPGASAQVTVVGANLQGELSLGEGVTIDRVLARDDQEIVVQATAAAGAMPGLRAVQVGDARLPEALAVYDRIARIEVVPSESIARIGGNGGPIPKVRSNYRAVGYAPGPDGKAGTEDDVRLGFVPATWSVEPFDEVAAKDEDVKYAGSMEATTGIFTPGDAGPNPKRKMSTNNLGNLAVIATARDGDTQVSGKGRLIVTVQTFFDVPLQ